MSKENNAIYFLLMYMSKGNNAINFVVVAMLDKYSNHNSMNLSGFP